MSRTIAGALLAASLVAAGALAQRPATVIGGWTLADPATPTDNGTATVVQISKAAPGVTITWVAFAAGEGGSTAVDFAATKGCRDQWFGARLGFDDPAVTHEAAVRAQIHEAFGSFARKCGRPPTSEAVAMAGFAEAFAVADKEAVAAAAVPLAGNAM